MASSLMRLSSGPVLHVRATDAPHAAAAESGAASPAAAAAEVRAALVHRAQQADWMRQQAESADADASDALAGPTLGVPLSVSTPTRNDSAPVAPYEFQPLEQSSQDIALSVDASPSAAAASSESSSGLGGMIARYVPKRVLGMTYLAVSAIVFSVMSLLVSLLSDELPSFQIVLARCIMQFGFGYATCRYYGVDCLGPPDRRKWLVIRGTVGFISFSCYYYSMSHLTLSDATTIFFTAPLYTGILGFIFLGEKVARADIALTLASVMGVIMVVRPNVIFGAQDDGVEEVDPDAGSSSGHTLGLLAAIAGSLVSAFVYIAIRKVGPGVNPLVLVCYMGLAGVLLGPFGAIVQTFVWPASFGSWVTLLFVGITSFFGQILFNAGVQMEKAGPASMIRNLDVAFSFFWQMIVQGIAPSPWSVLGAVVISASVVAMGVRKWRADQRQGQGQATTQGHQSVPAKDNLITNDEQMARLQQEQQASVELSLEHSDVDLQLPSGSNVRWHN